ncbi:MAG: hypothetical protein PHD60_09885, partial [Clostridia bacterium]|nr:hypothetical protein [Clostridia bacterium]
ISLNQIMNKLSTVSEELATSVVYNIDNINIEIEQRKERFRKSVDEVKEKAEERYDTTRKDMKEILEKKRNEFSEHVLLLKQQKDVILSERQRQSIEHFNRLLERSKGFARFYNNYPKASSLKFKNMIQVIRYKRNHEK